MDDVLLSLSILAIALGLLGIVAIFIWECCCRLAALVGKSAEIRLPRFSLGTMLIAVALAPPIIAGIVSMGFLLWAQSQLPTY
jgi:hypothetical protein